MSLRVFISAFIALLLLGGAAFVQAQSDGVPDASVRAPGQRRNEDTPFGLKDMMAKQKVEREKKDHEEMLERGDEALRLTKQLEASYAATGTLSSSDRAKLDSLERVVTKIRKELGASEASEDSEAAPLGIQGVEDPKPSTMDEAFKYLQTSTVKLVDELKKSTRFTISVIAIQSSNSVLKIVRFLRVKK